MNRTSPYFRASLLAICAAVALVMTALPGCATLSGGPSSQQLAAQVAVQYATGKFIEAGKTDASRLERAQETRKVAEALKGATSDEAATIATLRALALDKVNAAGLAPADRLLAQTLVDVAVTELTERTKRTTVDEAGNPVTVGVLDPEARVAVHKLLDWVIAAASAYG